MIGIRSDCMASIKNVKNLKFAVRAWCVEFYCKKICSMQILCQMHFQIGCNAKMVT